MTKEEITHFFRDGLRALGSYSPAFEPLIESAAEVAEIRAIAASHLREDGIVITELSREGEERKRYHPAWPVFLESSKELRALLGEMEMTVKSAKFTSGDEFDKLNIKLQQIYDEVTKQSGVTPAKSRRGRPAKRATN